MKHVLLVDDDASFLLSLSDGLSGYADRFKVHTAADGSEAIRVLREQTIDLVITDLKMPVMNGFELLAQMSKDYPSVRVIVMTAFGTTEIEQRVKELGSSRYLEKPVDLDDLTAKIFFELDACEKGFIRGFSLPTFLQLVEMERKSYALRIKSRGREGTMFFVDGRLVDAGTAEAEGIQAALEIVKWDEASIEISGCSKNKKNSIGRSVGFILLEAFRQEDERMGGEKESDVQTPVSGGGENAVMLERAFERPWEPTEVTGAELNAVSLARIEDKCDGLDALDGLGGLEANAMVKGRGRPVSAGMSDGFNTFEEGDEAMAQEMEQALAKLKDIDGFIGVGAFTAQGELVSSLSSSTVKLEELGALANDVLLKAQKASEVMGVGRGQMVHIEAPKAHILARCLNESTDFTSTSNGKAHIHMVLILEQETNLGLAKMRLSSVIQELAPFFR